MSKRWSAEQAHAWYEKMPWLVGCNYAPRTAINQLEMWQAETFDPQTIDQELGWAASVGMNSLRVFLHELVWKQGEREFLARIDQFLGIADKHGIGALLVFFDSCWHPVPRPGRQRDPEPGIHNSGWVQSPGVPVLQDPTRFDALQPYVSGVVEHFRNDHRVHAWDIWNEPCNGNHNSYGPRDLGHLKGDIVAPLLARAFEWAREAKPSQPLTSGIWNGDWSHPDKLRQIERLQVEQSDIVSFHNYSKPDKLARQINELRRYERPLICTEYMSRITGNLFEETLPIFKENRVAAYNWGLVVGRTQTHLPWDSWRRPYPDEGPPVWHHEVFHADGRPYRAEEVAALCNLTGRGQGKADAVA